MNFPYIDRIEPLLEAIKDKPEFVHKIKNGYQVIDYNLSFSDTFKGPHAALLMECRGIKFDLDGNIICRPLHKFFNAGERPDLEQEYARGPAVAYEKMDGSMIVPCMINGALRLTTRAGITDVSLLAEKYLSGNQAAALWSLCRDGLQPILEFTSPDNRIVLKYDKPMFTLLAIRSMCPGVYHNPQAVLTRREEAAFNFPTKYDKDVVVKDWKGEEGVVVWYPSGYALKRKADDYVLKHKTKDGLRYKKDVLKLILTGTHDDLASILDADEFSTLQYYAGHLQMAMEATETSLNWEFRQFEAGAEKTRKEYALWIKENFQHPMDALAFSHLNNPKRHEPGAFVNLLRHKILGRIHSETEVQNWEATGLIPPVPTF